MRHFSDNFFKTEALELLRSLNASDKPKWGRMSPQHMVEHLVGTWMISNGRASVPCMFKGEVLENRRKFLFGDETFPQSIESPVAAAKGLKPLRKPSYESAVDQLQTEIEKFFTYFEENPDALPTHPVFGDLNKDEWLRFQTKHMGHHMRQFGLIA